MPSGKESFFRQVLDASAVPIIVVDLGGEVAYANPDAERMLGPGLLGTVLTDHLPADARALVGAWLESTLSRDEGRSVYLETVTGQWGDTERSVDGTARALAGTDGFRGAVVALRDVSTYANEIVHLHRQWHSDHLTGLATRGAMLEVLRRQAARGTTGAVMFMDLDNFKLVNDAHGHRAGDAVLVQVAARIEASLPEGSAVSRFGGDEFAALLPGCSTAGASGIAQRLIAHVAEPCTLADGQQIAVTISAGIAEFPGDGPEDALAQPLDEGPDANDRRAGGPQTVY